MSGSIQMAKRNYRGDPGLFSFLGKAVGAVVGAVVPGGGAIVEGFNAAKRMVAGNGKPVNPKLGAAPTQTFQTQTILGTGPMFPNGALPGMPQLPAPQVNQTGLVNIVRPGTGGYGNQTQSGGGALVARGDGTPCGSGYHYNKSGYFTKRYGYIAPRTVCVKNRKRNPLNPRAASRALGRLSSTRKAMKGIERALHKIGGGQRHAAPAARKGGCGCKK